MMMVKEQQTLRHVNEAFFSADRNLFAGQLASTACAESFIQVWLAACAACMSTPCPRFLLKHFDSQICVLFSSYVPDIPRFTKEIIVL
jgi:hypothetical protein